MEIFWNLPEIRCIVVVSLLVVEDEVSRLLRRKMEVMLRKYIECVGGNVPIVVSWLVLLEIDSVKKKALRAITIVVPYSYYRFRYLREKTILCNINVMPPWNFLHFSRSISNFKSYLYIHMIRQGENVNSSDVCVSIISLYLTNYTEYRK